MNIFERRRRNACDAESQAKPLRRKRKHIRRFVQCRPAPGAAVFPLSACCSLFIAFLERPGMFKVGNKFGRRGRHPEGRGAVRCFILLMKRRSNSRTALIGVGGATTTSVPKRGAAREQQRLAAKAAEGEGRTLRARPDQNCAKFIGVTGDLRCASPTRTSRRVHEHRSRRRACLLEITRRPFCLLGFPG